MTQEIFSNLFYSIALPLIGLIAVISVLWYGGFLFSTSKKAKEMKTKSKMDVILIPFKEAPLWIWVVAILVFLPFIFHTIELWNPGVMTDVVSAFDTIGAVTMLIFYLVVVLLTTVSKKNSSDI